MDLMLSGMTLTASAKMAFGDFPKQIHEVEHAQQCYRSPESDRASCFAAVKRSAVAVKAYCNSRRCTERSCEVVGSDKLDWLWMCRD